MGAVNSIEDALGNLLMRAMPKKVPSWYAGEEQHSFPEAPENSLLLLAQIALQMPPDRETAARSFYTDGLGARLVSADQETVLRVGVGPSQIHFLPSQDSSEAEKLAQAWPGHLYCWVEDSRAVLAACMKLQDELCSQSSDPESCCIVEDVHNNSGEGSADILVLQDPAELVRFLVNPAPSRAMTDTIRSIDNSVETANALAVLEAIHLIAPGTGQVVARFYKHFLGAAVREREKGQHALLFALGPSLHQALTFLEDESVPQVQQDQVGSTPVPMVCMYMPSMAMFECAFKRCADAGILYAGPSTWEEASKACEFRFRSCVDPDTKHVVLELLHVVRVVEHPDCPLPAGKVWRTGTDAEPPLAKGAKLTLAEVAKHNKKSDAWVALNGQVLDVTRWIDVHPGGQRILMENVGTDVSTQWNMIHAQGTLDRKLSHPRGPRVIGPLAADDEQDDPLEAAAGA
mmetsp:Transcript_26913/g.47631  ORF Transcript_26913/g.47631 Transcript_26913/m.47631 type:complete len:460 (+) Transcript_26913:69-1448(+)